MNYWCASGGRKQCPNKNVKQSVETRFEPTESDTCEYKLEYYLGAELEYKSNTSVFHQQGSSCIKKVLK